LKRSLQQLYDYHYEPFDLYIIFLSQMAKGGFSFSSNLLYVLMYNTYCVVFLLVFLHLMYHMFPVSLDCLF
jgi:hypothetical protein